MLFGQSILHQQYSKLYERIDMARLRALQALEEFVARNHTLVIAMALASCIQFLREGLWLNGYEAAARLREPLEGMPVLPGHLFQSLRNVSVPLFGRGCCAASCETLTPYATRGSMATGAKRRTERASYEPMPPTETATCLAQRSRVLSA
jgi:hypothetical protein